jgi:hypothetical protein
MAVLISFKSGFIMWWKGRLFNAHRFAKDNFYEAMEAEAVIDGSISCNIYFFSEV